MGSCYKCCCRRNQSNAPPETRINGVVGLLVDPGAHDNLIGENTLQALGQQAGHKVHLAPLDQPMCVEGVGKSSQTAVNASLVPIGVGGQCGTYTASVIPGSDLPPLLGLKSLERKQAILDMGNHKLYFPGPGGVHINLSPGSIALDLDKSLSGHLILPTNNFPEGDMNVAQLSDERLVFATARAFRRKSN